MILSTKGNTIMNKITTNEHGKFFVQNKDGKRYCCMSAQFYEDNSWSLSISTQQGCPLKCTFCDVPLFGFYGNASLEDLHNQIEIALTRYSTETNGKDFYLHYARMGEPTFNNNVLEFTATQLTPLVNSYTTPSLIYPVLLTMLPNNNPNLKQFLQQWTEKIKNQIYNGNAGLQFSINSTDNQQRNEMFNNYSLSLEEISELSEQLPIPITSKYILNFIVSKDTIIDPNILDNLFSKRKFQIRIAPIRETKSTIKNNIETSETETYKICETFKNSLEAHEWEVTILL